jgi:hypothetical protein
MDETGYSVIKSLPHLFVTFFSTEILGDNRISLKLKHYKKTLQQSFFLAAFLADPALSDLFACISSGIF